MMHLKWFTIVACAVAITSVAAAQDTTLSDIVKGEKLQTSLAPKDLPADAVAIKITVAGQQSQMDSFMGLAMFSMPMMSGGGAANDASVIFRLLELSELAWTTGKSIQFGGEEFVVTYKYNLDYSQLAGMSGPNAKKPELALRLNLIKKSAITSLSPRLDVTKEVLAEVFKKVSKRAAQGPAGIGEVGTPSDAPVEAAAPTAPARPADVRVAATETIANAKQVALGIIMYANDYDDLLPYPQSTKDAAYVVKPYYKNDNVWSTLNPNGGILQFNMCIGGVTITSFENPSEVPIVYDSVPWPDGSRVVAFVDGHVKKVTAEEWPKVSKNTKLKLKRTAKPLPPGLGDHPGK